MPAAVQHPVLESGIDYAFPARFKTGNRSFRAAPSVGK
jgi:hypothetical protein